MVGRSRRNGPFFGRDLCSSAEIDHCSFATLHGSQNRTFAILLIAMFGRARSTVFFYTIYAPHAWLHIPRPAFDGEITTTLRIICLYLPSLEGFVHIGISQLTDQYMYFQHGPLFRKICPGRPKFSRDLQFSGPKFRRQGPCKKKSARLIATNRIQLVEQVVPRCSLTLE